MFSTLDPDPNLIILLSKNIRTHLSYERFDAACSIIMFICFSRFMQPHFFCIYLRFFQLQKKPSMLLNCFLFNGSGSWSQLYLLYLEKWAAKKYIFLILPDPVNATQFCFLFNGSGSWSQLWAFIPWKANYIWKSEP